MVCSSLISHIMRAFMVLSTLLLSGSMFAQDTIDSTGINTATKSVFSEAKEMVKNNESTMMSILMIVMVILLVVLALFLSFKGGRGSDQKRKKVLDRQRRRGA